MGLAYSSSNLNNYYQTSWFLDSFINYEKDLSLIKQKSKRIMRNLNLAFTSKQKISDRFSTKFAF